MRRRMLSAETFKKQRTHATPVRGSCLSERSKQKALPSRARRAEGLVILALFLTLAAAPLARAEYAEVRNSAKMTRPSARLARDGKAFCLLRSERQLPR